jgi:hypothetical protein
MRKHLFLAVAAAMTILGLTAGTALAHPDNEQTLHFVLTCDDGNVWNASFNGGPSAFHLDDGQLFIWKELAYVTPDGQSGSLSRGGNGFSGAPTVSCTYTGAVSGNAYTVTGFYPPAG